MKARELKFIIHQLQADSHSLLMLLNYLLIYSVRVLVFLMQPSHFCLSSWWQWQMPRHLFRCQKNYWVKNRIGWTWTWYIYQKQAPQDSETINTFFRNLTGNERAGYFPLPPIPTLCEGFYNRVTRKQIYGHHKKWPTHTHTSMS